MDNTINNPYLNNLIIFSALTPEDCEIFRKWARDNYTIGQPIPSIWHPAVRMECEKMNFEYIQQNHKTNG